MISDKCVTYLLILIKKLAKRGADFVSLQKILALDKTNKQVFCICPR